MAANRILLIRTSALGDVVHALPVLTALRRNQPSARIAWLVEDAFAPLLRGHPDLDEVISVRLRTWRRRPLAPRTLAELGRFMAALDRFSPDIVLDLMGNHKGGILSALSLADRRIGLERAARREPSSVLWISETVAPRGAHSVERMLSLLDALGIPPEPADFGGDRLLQGPSAAAGNDSTPSAPVLIHPGAGWANKRYPPKHWGEVAGLVHETLGTRVGVIVGPGEEALTEEVANASGGIAEIFWAPELPLLVELLRRASLVMGGDTGPIHLAHALGRPVLCLMGPTDPQRCGPYGMPGRALWRFLPCSFCHKRYSQIMPCLREIPPAAVADRACRMIVDETLPPAGPIDEGEAGCPILH